MNIGLAITRSARRYRDRLAVYDGPRQLTWTELDRRSNQLANALLDHHGLGNGDRVAILLPNRLEVCEALGGVTKAGLVYVGLNFRLAWPELQAILDNAEPRLIITDAEHRSLAQQAADHLDIPLVDVDDPGYDDLLVRGATTAPHTLHTVRPTDDALIVYTSGTTGTPKGVWFDHQRVILHAVVAAIEYDITADTRYLTAIPHNSSVHITLVPCVTMGAAIGFTDSRSFDPARWAAAVDTARATHSYLVPTQLYRLLDADPGGLDSLEMLGYGAAPMSPDKVAELIDRYGPIFSQLYGMAEIASIGTMLRRQDHVEALRHAPDRLGSAGQPSYAIDVRVVDPDGHDVRAGQRGEVIFGAGYVMKGYYRDPERTAQTLKDGWVHSGDVGVVDDDGFLHIVDRIKDLIIRGGHNISPTEIEAVIHRHPDVLEVGVIGVPDAEWGERILAVVAPRPGMTVDQATLLGWIDQQDLPSIKRPQAVEVVEALPKNAVGKVAKNELRAARWRGDRRV
ncbi:class I adenylate-forming enzyme family protein [Euzebya tangerina]|uniref:class I adenylate-forming enzyme family protein n=1 Tax=Euzebya tangerina TaxID=591198 RepID=UPI000E317EC0|nr:AMP-binding protein [Euzebya tangerina]